VSPRRLRAWAARALAGERRGAARALLAPAAKLYELAALVRAEAYATGYLSTRRLARPVISVGNLTLGGTGKTPLVAALAAYLRDQHYEVVVLTRGYGRKRAGREVLRWEAGAAPPDAYERGGDEPALLARELPGVTVVVDPDRHGAGAWAERELDPDVFLLDDGFQHLRLARDLNLLVVDATDPFGGLRSPPLGRLREPLQGLRRADAVVVTRADRPFDEALVERVVRGIGGEVPVFYAYHDLVALRPLAGGQERAPYALRGRRVGVITAVGNPRVFVEDLENAGVDVVSESLSPDHHDFRQSDVDAAVAAARRAGAEALVTTEKDAVKLERLDLSAAAVYAARIRFRSDQEALIKSLCLKAILRHGRRSNPPSSGEGTT
jgi:tetraacyldisaccharide 4'-kinase